MIKRENDILMKSLMEKECTIAELKKKIETSLATAEKEFAKRVLLEDQLNMSMIK